MKLHALSFAALMSISSFSSGPESSFLVSAAKQNGNKDRGNNGNGNGNEGGSNRNKNGKGGYVNDDHEPDPFQYIVKVRKNDKEVDVVNNAKKNNGKFLKKVNKANALVMKFPNERSAKRFQDMGYDVEIDQPRYFDTRSQKSSIRGSGDYAASQQDVGNNRHLVETTPWGIRNVYEDSQGNPNVPPLSFFTESSVTHPMCIIDSGYQLDHPDLPTTATAADPSQDSPTSNLYFGIDGCKHGSHVAGTIAATGYNEVGVVGVYPDAPGMKIVKVFGSTNGGTDCGWSYTSSLIEAAEHCRDSGAKIISMSLGGGGSSSTERSLFEDLYNNDDMLTIAAAGNGGNSAFSYPASYPSIMSVGAIDESNKIASFSQHNSEVDISGPGVGVLSTGGSGYIKYSGTSMATPHVSGVALVLWNKYPACSNSDIRTALEASAKDLGTPGRDNYYGHGAVKYWAADTYLSSNFACANNNNAPPTSPTPPAPPTNAPVGTTPSPTPTPCVDIQLELQTDYFGEETSWELRDYGSIIESGSQYSKSAMANINLGCHTLDYDNVNRYEFIIKDSYGDGMCCDYGDGFYKLKADGKVIKEGGDFGTIESFRFPGGNFRLELQTDFWGNETSWEIRGPGGNVLRSRNRFTYDDIQTYLHWEHLYPHACFFFEMKDSYGDGIYFGYYKLFWNDEEVAYIPGNSFSFSETTIFGSNCPTSSYSDSGPITVPIRDPPSPGSQKRNKENDKNGNVEFYKKKERGMGNGKGMGNKKQGTENEKDH